MGEIAPADEGRHESDGNPAWVEAHLFDVVHGNGDLGLSIELLLWPQHRQAGFHLSVVELNRPLVSLVDFQVAAPPSPSREIRAPGLWAEVGIQTPLDHVTVDIEAFAVALDDPDDVFAGAYGVRTAVGCELEWETDQPPIPRAGASGAPSYEVPCRVHGELLLDDRTIEIDGWGWRSHRWGSPTTADRIATRGRNAAGEWLLEHQVLGGDALDELTVIGDAPVPDPSFDRPLRQQLVRTRSGVLAWTRHVES